LYISTFGIVILLLPARIHGGFLLLLGIIGLGGVESGLLVECDWIFWVEYDVNFCFFRAEQLCDA